MSNDSINYYAYFLNLLSRMDITLQKNITEGLQFKHKGALFSIPEVGLRNSSSGLK